MRTFTRRVEQNGRLGVERFQALDLHAALKTAVDEKRIQWDTDQRIAPVTVLSQPLELGRNGYLERLLTYPKPTDTMALCRVFIEGYVVISLHDKATIFFQYRDEYFLVDKLRDAAIGTKFETFCRGLYDMSLSSDIRFFVDLAEKSKDINADEFEDFLRGGSEAHRGTYRGDQ